MDERQRRGNLWLRSFDFGARWAESHPTANLRLWLALCPAIAAGVLAEAANHWQGWKSVGALLAGGIVAAIVLGDAMSARSAGRKPTLGLTLVWTLGFAAAVVILLPLFVRHVGSGLLLVVSGADAYVALVFLGLIPIIRKGLTVRGAP